MKQKNIVPSVISLSNTVWAPAKKRRVDNLLQWKCIRRKKGPMQTQLLLKYIYAHHLTFSNNSLKSASSTKTSLGFRSKSGLNVCFYQRVCFLTGREEVVDCPGGVERGQLQTLGEGGQGVALDCGRVVHPPIEQQFLDQELVRQEEGELRVLTLPQTPLGLFQQNHHHVHRKQPAHHLEEAAQHTVHTHGYDVMKPHWHVGFIRW